MRTVLATTLGFFVCVVACTQSTPSEPSKLLSSVAGTWRTTTATQGQCDGITYTITPTGPTAANITFSATCAGVPITGSGTGTATDSTVDWTTSGTAGECTFSLTGTAVPESASDLRITFSGTVCNLSVNGSKVLQR
jgi:hypothetical protein